MTSADGGQRELILQVATRLFAALGYDATSLSQIAEATGMDASDLLRQVGGKRDLYLAVMERLHEIEMADMREAVKGAPASDPEQAASLVHRIIDCYLDLCVANPELPALWMHRWLSDASDVTELEQRYTEPLMSLISGAIDPSVASGYTIPDLDVEYLMWSMLWCVNGFAQGGVLDKEGVRRRMDDPEALRRFRAHLHRSVHRATGLPGSPP
ncbi:AcrR family transcriptional regulator [Streptosporangium album]|uniref:AcrR family transcriptional regulator n=1 Tax=Streptosporangium album TaxID=47479 RepID=A0A7W7S4P5_9ACTN|nr:TetR/AcrR family transcriptional regulator [Streptosporangium album]MBB4943849.1 AcrR family transcriptional regulator [Streptosporangium album]